MRDGIPYGSGEACSPPSRPATAAWADLPLAAGAARCVRLTGVTRANRYGRSVHERETTAVRP